MEPCCLKETINKSKAEQIRINIDKETVQEGTTGNGRSHPLGRYNFRYDLKNVKTFKKIS